MQNWGGIRGCVNLSAHKKIGLKTNTALLLALLLWVARRAWGCDKNTSGFPGVFVILNLLKHTV